MRLARRYLDYLLEVLGIALCHLRNVWAVPRRVVG